MELKTKIVFVVFLGLLQLGLSWASCSASATGFKVLGVTWGNSTGPIAAGPGGSDVPLTVTMQSYGTTCNLANIEGVLEVTDSYSNFNGSSAYPAYYLQQLTPSEIFNMVFHLDIANNVSVGLNTTSSYYLYLYYNITNYTVNTARNEQILTIGIPMRGSPSLSFIPKSRSLIAGEVNNVTLEVKNSGTGYAYDVATAVTSSSSLSLENAPETINSLAPGATENITLRLYVSPSSSGQSLSLSLNPHYISPYGYNTSISSDISMYAISALQSSVSVSTSASELVSGSVNKVNITITNNGASIINNLSAILEPQSPLTLIGSEGYANFGSIGPGSSVHIPAKLYVSSSSASGGAVASLDVQLAYDGQSEDNARVLSFLTPGYINLTQVSTTILPSSPSTGGIFSLTSTLNNLGTSTASAATVTTYPPSGIDDLGSNTTFIGDIAPDSPTAFTVSFRISSSAKPGTYIIPVVVSYSNNLHQRINETMDFQVEIGSGSPAGALISVSGPERRSQGASGSGTGQGAFLPLLITVVASGIGIYIYRKRKGRVRNR